MELIISKLKIPVEKDGIDEYLKAASQKLNCNIENLSFLRILSKSLDMADREQFYYEISIAVSLPDSFETGKLDSTNLAGTCFDATRLSECAVSAALLDNPKAALTKLRLYASPRQARRTPKDCYAIIKIGKKQLPIQ